LATAEEQHIVGRSVYASQLAANTVVL